MTFWKELTTASMYTNSPYEYATNQLAHWAIGFLLATVVSATGLYFLGEFMHKSNLFAIMAGAFLCWEVFQRKVSINKVTLWDHIEDWLFMSVYGSGAAIFLFFEVEPGSPLVYSNVNYGIPFVGLVVFHLSVGIIARSVNRKRNARQRDT